jgi:ribosomal protein L18
MGHLPSERSMSGYQIKKMNWTQPVPAYKSMQAWRAKRQEATARFETNMSNTLSVLQSAAYDTAYAVGELAAKRAMQRMGEEFRLKQENAAKVASAENNLISQPKNSVFSYGEPLTLSGGARVDLGNNTITHSDGTVVDLKTGIAKVDVTV